MNKIKNMIKLIFPIYTKEIVMVVMILFILLGIQFLSRDRPKIIDQLNRPDYFEGNKEVTLYYDSETLGVSNEAITFSVDKLSLEKNEATKYLNHISELLKKRINNQYMNYTSITGPIQLNNRIDQCNITYQLSNKKLVDDKGWLNYRIWPNESKIIISYNIEFEHQHIKDELEIVIKDTSFTNQYKQAFLEYQLKQEVELMNEIDNVNNIELPNEVIFYNDKAPESLLNLVFIWVGIIVSCSILSYFEKNLNYVNQMKKRRVELTYLINSFTLLYQTGMTIQKSFYTTIGNRILTMDSDDLLYEEMNKLKLMMENNHQFEEVLYTFEHTMDSRECRRFIRLILQNLKQGDDQLVNQLENMTRIMWEDRIRSARKESEKASSKLVLPMLLIFIVILIISIVPTFLEVKSIF